MNIAVLLGGGVLSSLAMIALAVLNVILTLGMVRFILDIWHGQPTALSVLFGQRHRFWTSVLSSLLVSLIVFGVIFAMLIPVAASIFISESLGGILAIVAALAGSVLLIWMGLRYEMTTACIVLEPAFGATDCMRMAWRASKGNTGRLFCNAFVLNLPLFFAQALLMGYQTFLAMNGQTLNIFGSLVLDVASTLISALLTGYIALGTYALHEHLLDEYRRRAFPQSTENLWNEAPAELPAAEEDSDNL